MTTSTYQIGRPPFPIIDSFLNYAIERQTMKLTPSESKLVELLHKAGGSICPGAETSINSEAHRLFRRLERKGVVSVEMADDGPNFELTPLGWAEAVNG